MPVCGYEYKEDKLQVRVNCMGCLYGSSIEDYPECMARVIDIILEVKKVTSVILARNREYEYDYPQVKMLTEVAGVIEWVMREKLIPKANMAIKEYSKYYPKDVSRLEHIVTELLRKDPIGAYVETIREIRNLRFKAKKASARVQKCLKDYITALDTLKRGLEGTEIIKKSMKHLAGYHVGDRSLYRQMFMPSIRPNFMLTRYMVTPPEGGRSVDRYKAGDADVEIYKLPNTTQYLYHVLPPEFRLSEEKYSVLDAVRRYMATHRPKTAEFVRSEKVREVFYNIGKDMIAEISGQMNVSLNAKELEQFANILTRYTAGMGVLEILLADEKIQDIYINSPIERQPILIYHQDWGECKTNLIPTKEDAEAWATRLRISSGRPLDEANPVLDTDVALPGGNARFAVITNTLSPHGLGFAIRRHRDRPWTLPLFIKNRMISPLAAGLLSFLIDGTVSMLVAGGRGSGKCLKGSELVQLASGEFREIKSIVEGSLAKNNTKRCDDGYYSSAGNLEILTLDNDLKIKPARVSHVWKRRAHPENIKIVTKSGREIICTPEHPFFVLHGIGINQIKAADIKVGERIAAVRKLRIRPAGVKLPGYVQPKRAKKINIPAKISPDLMEFLGYIYGDGHIRKSVGNKMVLFTNNNPVLQKSFKDLALKLFGIENIKRSVDGRNGVVSQRIFSSSLVSYLTDVLLVPSGKKADIINMPSFLCSLPKKETASFIRALFDCDSSVSKRGREIEYSTASEKLAFQIQSFLSRFGIISSLKEKTIRKKPYYRVWIRGDEMKKYTSSIGFQHPEKDARARNVLETPYDYTTTDTIPISGKLLKKLRLTLGIQNGRELRRRLITNIWNIESGNWLPTRKNILTVAKIFKERYIEIAAQETCMSEAMNLSYAIKSRYMFADTAKSLALSQTEIASASGTSRGSVARYMKGTCGPVIFMQITDALSRIFRERIRNGRVLNCLKLDSCNLPACIEKSPLTYAALSDFTSIPETSLKGYAYGSINPPPERAVCIRHALSDEIPLYCDALNHAKTAIPKFRFVDVKKTWEDVLSLLDKLNVYSKDISKACGLSVSLVEGFRHGRYSPGLASMEKILEFALERFEKVKHCKDDIEKLARMADSDIFWDKIASVEKVKPTEQWVYDLTVDGTHSFVASGLIAHNTSMLGAMMLEILPQVRVVSLEDTLELPIDQLRSLGYNVQRLKTRSVITRVETEMPAEEALRTALRLGDSALIIGEIRSKEASALYEAMRIGALSNVVAGTIHGESAYGVYDRVVNDLGVPPTSFKATDIIPICKSLRSADGMQRFRRMTEITEVRKEWDDNPSKEGGFINLMEYSSKEDALKPTDTLVNGESEVLNRIASYVKEWSGNWDTVWENIQLRARIKETMVKMAEQLNSPDLLESKWTVKSNAKHHLIAESVRKEIGHPDPLMVYDKWLAWFKRAATKAA